MRLFYANLQVAHDIMKTAFLLLLCILWSLVAVHSQTEYPYVSFMGDILPNHAYVDLTTVGEDTSASGDTVRCHTDLTSCCTGSDFHRGDWFFPNGNALSNAAGSGDIYKSRGDQVIHLCRRNDAISPSSIYRCEIPTVAVNDDVDIITGESVYVGLYPPNEGNQFI